VKPGALRGGKRGIVGARGWETIKERVEEQGLEIGLQTGAVPFEYEVAYLPQGQAKAQKIKKGKGVVAGKNDAEQKKITFQETGLHASKAVSVCTLRKGDRKHDKLYTMKGVGRRGKNDSKKKKRN